MALPGQLIQRLRKERGYSLRALAKRAGSSVAYLSKLERDESSPTVAFLTRLADALDVSVEQLVDSTPQPEREPELPASLKAFIEEYRGQWPELNQPEWRQTLQQVRLRGKYPEDSDEWAAIFTSMRKALKP